MSGVATQGRQDAHQWVTSYVVSYSRNGRTFFSYKQYGRTRVKAMATKTYKLLNVRNELFKQKRETKSYGLRCFRQNSSHVGVAEMRIDPAGFS